MAPRVFVSSTVKDLGDLRSGIRFTLEQFGFEVLMSEAPDFPHALDREAWRAALEPIREADYYVLLLGYRAGSITNDGISVTHAEFRFARSLHREFGRPQLVLLGRSQMLERIGWHDGGAPEEADDWAAVVRFVEEVRQAELPGDSNWVHPFGTFSDVVTVLRTALRLSGPLRRRMHEANVVAELRSNGQSLFTRLKDQVMPVSGLLRAAPATQRGEITAMDRHEIFRLVLFRFSIPGPGRLSTVAIQEAILSGEFLDYNPQSGAMEPTPIWHAMTRLRQRIARYETLLTIISTPPSAREFAELPRSKEGGLVSGDLLDILFGLRDEIQNIEHLTRGLARYYLGLDAAWVDPPLNAPTPDPAEADRIEAETVREVDIDAWLGLD